MSNSSASSAGYGNTKHTPKQISPSKKWIFTWNNYDSSKVPKFLELIKSDKYVFQEEKGENGTPHLQGYIEFKNKVRPSGHVGIKEIHWEKCRNTQASIDYCSKEETKVGKTWSNIPLPEKLVDPLTDKIPYKWQQDIIDLCEKKPNDRTIHWYWEPMGNTGKTALCKHLCMKYEALMLSGKANDIKCGVASWVEKKKPTKVFIFHFTRSMEEFISYEALEAIKDGIFYSGKYESSMVMYNPPHVLVFANFEPKVEALSLDRWRVKRLDYSPAGLE